jgi:hypothetical protein
VLGSGIPLFAGPCDLTRLEPAATHSFDTGVTVTTYTRR